MRHTYEPVSAALTPEEMQEWLAARQPRSARERAREAAQAAHWLHGGYTGRVGPCSDPYGLSEPVRRE